MIPTENLAPYASSEAQSRGRLYPDFPHPGRSCFQRDRDRLIHSAAFRRLDGKTQVFAYHEGKNFRTRLTHSIEVSQITRTICKSLHLNEELGEAIALAHDLGHSPFGHAGEHGLDKVMRKYGGFDHNLQSFKIMTKLEIHYPEFEGLNLTWEVLEGTLKHNGPMSKINSDYLKEYNKKFDFDLKRYPSLEAQIAGLADDIAYLNHDLDDGCRSGMFAMKQLQQLPFVEEIVKQFESKYCVIEKNLTMYAVTRNMISRMIYDILDNTRANIEKLKIQSNEDIRRQKKFVADFSENMKKEIALLRAFLTENFYTCTNVAIMDMKSERIIEELFQAFMDNPLLLPPTERRKMLPQVTEKRQAEIISEYIAGMTDMNAIEEHQKLFNLHTRF